MIEDNEGRESMKRINEENERRTGSYYFKINIDTPQFEYIS